MTEVEKQIKAEVGCGSSLQAAMGLQGEAERRGTGLTVNIFSSHCKCVASGGKRAPSLAKEGAGPSKSAALLKSVHFWHSGLSSASQDFTYTLHR